MFNNGKKNLAKCNEEYLEKLRKNNNDAYNYLMRGIQIISRLNEKMFEAYIVGGAVRDIILERNFHDIDICTTAAPNEVMAIFPNGDAKYADLGCITLREGTQVFEITTFRIEEYAGKSRRPTKIHYSKKLIDDIYRRDYTISALALTANFNIIDITKKGMSDIKNHVVRVIGKGKIRYNEDPIRIFRGLELVAKYNFRMNFDTISAMRSQASVLMTLTHGRITEELLKIFRYKYAYKAFYYIAQYELFKPIKEYSEWIHCMIGSFKKLSVMDVFATLYYQMGKIPANSPFNKNEIAEIQNITKTIRLLETNKIDRMIVYQNTYEALLSANRILLLIDKDYKSQANVIKRFYRTAYIKDRQDLNFKTEDLIKIMHGETGPKVGLIMNRLTKLVVMGDVSNNYSMLKQEVLKMLTMSDQELEQPLYSENKDNIVEEKENADPEIERLNQLRKKYMVESKSIYDAFIKQIKNFDSMTIEEQRIIEQDVLSKTKTTILSTNPEYNELFEKKGVKKNEEI